MAEFLRPDADVSIGGWTTQTGSTTSLFDALNETSLDDADYIISSPDPVADIYRFRISDPSAIIEDGTVRYRYEKIGSGIGNLTVRLIQGHTTWNPLDLANLSLSNGNLTGTDTLTVNNSGARTGASESAGLKYAECILDDYNSAALVGIANAATDLGVSYLGFDLDGIGWQNTGFVLINATLVATVASYTIGDTLCIAVNFDSEKIWFRVNGGDWNNDVIGNQNPATNTGGISFSSLNAGPYFLAMSLAGGTSPPIGAITANFGATAYNQTPPSGATNFGAEAVIAEWEHTDIAASFVTAEQTLTTPQFDSITDFYDLIGELEANLEAWSPLDLPGLIGWYKADTGVTTSSGNVTAVTDQSGIGHNLVNSGTVPFNATGFNGFPAFDFLAANNAALVCSGFALSGLPATVYLAGRMHTSTAAYGGAAAYGIAGQNDWNSANSAAFVTRSNLTAALDTVRNSVGTSKAMTTGTEHRFGAIYRDVGGGSYELAVIVDGTEGASADWGETTITTGGTLVIGNRWSGAVGSSAWQGPIPEIVVCDGELSATDLALLDAYYFAKFDYENLLGNLLTQHNAFDHANWNPGNVTVTANETTGPYGGLTADRINESSDGAPQYHAVAQSVVKATSSKTYNFAVSAKYPGSGRTRFSAQLDSEGGSGRFVTFDVAGGQMGTSVGGFGGDWSGGTATIDPQPDGWYRCQFSGVVSDSAAVVRVLLFPDQATGTSAMVNNYTGNGTAGLWFNNAVLTEA